MERLLLWEGEKLSTWLGGILIPLLGLRLRARDILEAVAMMSNPMARV